MTPMTETADRDVVIVEAARTPLGRRNGGLSTVHPAELLGAAQQAVIERSGIDPSVVGQVVAGCVTQTGEQTFNIARTAWLASGFPMSVAGTTVDSQCGSSQQATNLGAALVKSGVVDVALPAGGAGVTDAVTTRVGEASVGEASAVVSEAGRSRLGDVAPAAARSATTSTPETAARTGGDRRPREISPRPA